MNKKVCTYPECHCPFDMGEDGKCFQGFKTKFKSKFSTDKKDSKNNGGKTDYYQLSSAPFEINDFDDFAEWRGMNGNQFNIGKVVWAFNIGRHSGTDYVRDLNKIIHYANRELDRLSRKGK